MGIDLNQIKDVFIKEDPFALNEKMNNLQVEKFEWFKEYARAGDNVARLRAIIQDNLRANYSSAIDGTKKNASMEALELWICAKDITLGTIWKKYIEEKEKKEVASRILTTLEADLSALQSRANIFKQ